MINRLTKLWRGDYSLPRAYWLYSSVVPIAIALPLVSLMGYFESYFLGYLLLTVVTVYGFITMVGTWRSADQYLGPAAWKTLAKITIMVGFVGRARDLVLLTIVPEYTASRLGVFPILSSIGAG